MKVISQNKCTADKLYRVRVVETNFICRWIRKANFVQRSEIMSPHVSVSMKLHTQTATLANCLKIINRRLR